MRKMLLQGFTKAISKNERVCVMGSILEKSLSLDDVNTSILTEYDPDCPRYRLRELLKYCRGKGIEPKDLSEEELKTFEMH